MICCLSAWELRDELGDRWDDLLAECAIYAAASRQPWSEPPITDPPAIDANQRGDIEELRQCVATLDRLRAERWLAKRHRDADFAHDYFMVATDDFEDLGHKLIVAVTAWKLAKMFPPYPALRTAIWEMTAYRGTAPSPVRGDVIAQMVAGGGDIESAHAVFLLDAALETGDAEVIQRVGARVPARPAGETHVGARVPARPAGETPAATPPIYRLARDYGAYLKSFVVATRLGDPRIVEAAKYNLDHAPSFEDFSFA